MVVAYLFLANFGERLGHNGSSLLAISVVFFGEDNGVAKVGVRVGGNGGSRH